LRIISLILTLILLFGIAYVAMLARDPAFPGADVAVLIGSILGGPILLKRAITVPVIPEPEAESEPESPRLVEADRQLESHGPVESDTAVEQPTRPRYPSPDDWAGDA
jgi:hypothetical protein